MHPSAILLTGVWWCGGAIPREKFLTVLAKNKKSSGFEYFSTFKKKLSFPRLLVNVVQTQKKTIFLRVNLISKLTCGKNAKIM
jgi:hypothetical protein